MHRSTYLFLRAAFVVLATAAIWSVHPVAWAQEPVAVVRVLGVDTSAFPTVALTFTAQDAVGRGRDSFSRLTVAENGRPVERYDLLNVYAGVDVTFVIDANRTINAIDLIGDVSRLAKVRTAIADYAARRMSTAGVDRVSVIVPEGDGAAFLLEETGNPDAVINAMATYDPQTLATAAPVQAMLELAFRQAAAREPTTRYQAIILLSDTENLRRQVDFFALRASLAQSQAVFFGAILGRVASQDEIEAMAELYIPSGGYAVHMPASQSLDAVLATVQSNGYHNQLRYRSRVNASGEQQLDVEVEGVAAVATFAIEVLPPEIAWLSDGRPLDRSGDPAQPFGEWEPTALSLEAQVRWPDGHPRTVTAVRFFVDDLEQLLPEPPVLDITGRLTWVWLLNAVGPGEYRLRLQLDDELGLTADSPTATQVVRAQVVEEPATPTPLPPPTATPTAVQETVRSLSPWITERNATIVLVLLIPLLALIALRKWRRRRQPAPPAAPTPPPPRAVLPGNVYLEILPSSPGYGDLSDLIPVQGETATIGSDPFRAQIVLDHESISRLHASIRFEDGQFVLYDEGSAYGTLVNFQRVGLTPRVLRHGDEIQLGQVHLRLRIFDEALPAATAPPAADAPAAAPPAADRPDA